MAVTGKAKVIRNLLQESKAGRRAVAAGMYAVGHQIHAAAVKRTPIKHAFLRNSAYVAPPMGSSYKPTVEIGYGVDYAVYVHERTELKHKKGEAKFLQKAVDAASGSYLRDVARIAEKLFAKGAGVDAIPKRNPVRPRYTKGGNRR